ncbi:MAG TPA: hypothetical protein VGM51_13020 [Armatimonadota bacterium]|jgi:hypothetical protein
MAKVMVPVVRLNYEDAYPNEIVEEMTRLGLWKDDELTFTGRIVVPDAKGAREQATERLRALLPEEHAENLLALLRSNDWNLSFFVDCW